ncbi:MAG TPA: NAD(P)H-dependent glycerol-3-phosphate dehydrogenase [Acidobacteriaceae bacterium]|jgi:glycerol-3-phosphate dehydrogenase (NAD(P)+)
MSRITIIGSGSWGTALAISFARNSRHSIVLWSHTTAVAEAIEKHRQNLQYLPGYSIPEQVSATADLASSVENAEIVVNAIPSQHVRETYRILAPHLASTQILLSATKGIEDHSFLRMTEVISQEVDRNLSRDVGNARPYSDPKGFAVGVLSGPSFAQEVAAGLPTAITVAFSSAHVAARIQEEFSSPFLRLYTNDDVIGVELAGALKNVIAIAAGIASGLELGHNSMAAIVTRGIAEITRLAIACGGRRETLAGLSGLGDLVLTCTGPLSRNRTVGVELGRGRELNEILAGLGGKIAEGVRTTSAALGLAKLHGVEMPITEQMFEILNHGKSAQDAIRDLMSRPGRDE